MQILTNEHQVMKDLKELERIMNRMPKAVQTIMYQNMNRAAAREFVKRMKSNQSWDDVSGRTRSMIKVVFIDSIENGKTIKNGKAHAAMTGKLSHLLDQGTVERVQKTTGRKTGKIEAKDIAERALNSGSVAAGKAAIRAAEKTVGKMIDVSKGKGSLTARDRKILAGG